MFKAYGYSYQEGELPAGSLVFSSDRDGALGSGRTLRVSGLSAGSHVITVKGTDQGGTSGTASVSISYIDKVPGQILIAAPQQLEFGTVNVGQTKDLELAIAGLRRLTLAALPALMLASVSPLRRLRSA